MKHAANEETRGAGAGSAARDAPLSSRVVGLGGTACWPAGRSVLIDSFGLASSAMARVVALPNGLFRGVLHELSRGSQKSEARPTFGDPILPTGPTECSCTPSNLSELVELVNGVTQIHYGKYNKADHEKSRIYEQPPIFPRVSARRGRHKRRRRPPGHIPGGDVTRAPSYTSAHTDVAVATVGSPHGA